MENNNYNSGNNNPNNRGNGQNNGQGGRKPSPMMVLVTLLVTLLVFSVCWKVFIGGNGNAVEVPYSEFVAALEREEIESIQILL